MGTVIVDKGSSASVNQCAMSANAANNSAIEAEIARTAAENLALQNYTGVMKVSDVITKGDIRAFGAVGNGTTDCTAAIQAAQAENSFPYVPAGSYYVTSYRADGLWGPGKLIYAIGNIEVVLPKSPQMASRVQAILAKFARSSLNGGVIGLVGDSISEGYYSTSIDTTWFNKLQKMLNVTPTSGIMNDCEITNLGDPNRYHLTYSGSYSIGTNGPVQQSLILQPGASVTFTGRYKYVDVVYEQSPTGGNLVMARNGTTFKTINTSGVSTHDVSTFPTTTGDNSTSSTFTLTASGGIVELTGIWKLNQILMPGLFFSRLARSAQSTQLFSQDAVLASTIKHIKSLSNPAKNIVFCAIGVNNANTDVGTAGTTPGVYGQQLGKMFARWLNAGFYVIAIGTIYPSTAYLTVHNNYPAIAAMQKQVCEQYGIPLISMDQVDWQNTTAFGGSLLQDGLHPNESGNEVMLEVITEFLSSPAFDPEGNTNNNRVYTYTPSLLWFNPNNGATTPAATIGVSNARYWLDGPKCKVQLNLSGITSATTQEGDLAITLPFTGYSNMRITGTIGAVNGITGATRGKMWTLQNPPFSNVALLRTLDPVSGNYDSVATIPNGSLIDFEIEYIVQE